MIFTRIVFFDSRHNKRNRGFACLKVDEKKSKTFIGRGKTKVIGKNMPKKYKQFALDNVCHSISRDFFTQM